MPIGLLAASLLGLAASSAGGAGSLPDLIARAAELGPPSPGSPDSERIAHELRQLGTALAALAGSDTDPDRAPLLAYLAGRRVEIEDLRLSALLPASYLMLESTEELARAPCAHSDREVRIALDELRSLPRRLTRAVDTLESTARWWVESAIASTRYASELIGERASHICVDDPRLRDDLTASLAAAKAAVASFESWLAEDLLPTSDRPPTWSLDQFESLAVAHEGLEGYTDRGALAILAEERERVTEQIESRLSMHPAISAKFGGAPDLEWRWSSVLPALERDARELGELLASSDRLAVNLEAVETFDILLTPGAGAPRVRFQPPGEWAVGTSEEALYYPLRPLPERVSEIEHEETLVLYSPRLTRARAYRGMLGALAASASSSATAVPSQPSLYKSACMARARELYLERWLQEEGILASLPGDRRVDTEIALLELRRMEAEIEIGRIQVARGEIGPEASVASLRERTGLPAGVARSEVRRVSVSPLPPGCAFLGERALLELRAQFLGGGRSLPQFHAALWRHQELPLTILRQRLAATTP